MDLKNINIDLKNIDIESIKSKILAIDKKTLIKFGIGFGSVVFFLIIYYAVLNPIVNKKKIQIDDMFNKNFEVNFTKIDGQEQFLSKLKGVTDPEEKRKVIGEEFVKIFTNFSKENGPFTWRAQGTLYPDVIESGVSKGPASVIKTHHNVGGLPDWLDLKVLEPLRDLYKDEVRNIAKII